MFLKKKKLSFIYFCCKNNYFVPCFRNFNTPLGRPNKQSNLCYLTVIVFIDYEDGVKWMEEVLLCGAK